MAAGLDEKDGKVQVNTLVYAMGGNANDIFKSFHLAERDTVYATVKRRFKTHFVGCSNEHLSTDAFKVRKNLWLNLLNPFTSSPKLASSDLSKKS